MDLSTASRSLEAPSTDFACCGTYGVDVNTLLDMDPRALGQPTSSNRAAVVVAIGDSELLDQVLAITAVVGVEPLVLGDVGLLRQHWASASMALLGIDQATRIATMGLPLAKRSNGQCNLVPPSSRCHGARAGCPTLSPT